MKRLLVGFSIFVLAATGFTAQAFAAPGAPTNKPNPPSEVCYALDSFPTDFLILRTNPGLRLVTGVYRQCVVGTDPGTGSADALVVGTIQDVPEGSTIDYSPFNSDVQTQISLVGSILTGNFGGGNEDKASPCWLHLVFEDAALTDGYVIGACGWFSGNQDKLYDAGDSFTDSITQIDCSLVLDLGPSPGVSCESLLP